MSNIKKLFLHLMLLIILSFCIWFIILDFSRFLTRDYTYDIYPSGVLKRINAVLAFFVSLAAGKDKLSTLDSRRMKFALLFTCLGEALFLVRARAAGIIMFGMCQALLVVRNGTGLIQGLKHAKRSQKEILTVSGLILLIILSLLPFISVKLLDSRLILFVVFIYAVLLCLSLWTAFACHILNLLPGTNSRMAAAGMFCFFCCDVLVGLDAVLAPGMVWLTANSFIWVFYIPALVLLALSSYRY